jgi:hypothetical protein
MTEREYEYRLKSGRVMTRAALWAVGALFMGYMALTNDRGLVLFVVPLSKERATMAYAIFGGLAGLFSIVDAIKATRGESLRQRIAFTEDGVIVPKSAWTAEEVLIPYESVRDMNEFNEPDSLVVIRHQGGEFTLRCDMHPDERAYAEIVQNLALRVRSAQVRESGQKPEASEPKQA